MRHQVFVLLVVLGISSLFGAHALRTPTKAALLATRHHHRHLPVSWAQIGQRGVRHIKDADDDGANGKEDDDDNDEDDDSVEDKDEERMADDVKDAVETAEAEKNEDEKREEKAEEIPDEISENMEETEPSEAGKEKKDRKTEVPLLKDLTKEEEKTLEESKVSREGERKEEQKKEKEKKDDKKAEEKKGKKKESKKEDGAGADDDDGELEKKDDIWQGKQNLTPEEQEIHDEYNKLENNAASIEDALDHVEENKWEAKIKARVHLVAGETQALHLSTMLGNLWREMHEFSVPFYKEYMRHKLKMVEKKQVKLERKLLRLRGHDVPAENKKEENKKEEVVEKPEKKKRKAAVGPSLILVVISLTGLIAIGWIFYHYS